jgi:integrase
MGPSWRNLKHREQWEMSLGRRDAKRGAGTYAKPLRKKPVSEITTEDLLSVLKPIWQTRPETASRLRGRIEAVLDAAKAQGHRSAENVARWKGHLDKLLPAPRKLSRGHHAAMPYAEVPAFMARLAEIPTTSNNALAFTILTAARTNEVTGALWPELDLAGKLWTVPAERMKGKREHHVPLSDAALAILRRQLDASPDQSGHVFPGGKPGKALSVMALTMALRRAGAGDFTVHGFRSSFRDWTGDETTFPESVAEAALAHKLRDKTESAYRRATALEKRRKLMRAWDEYLSRGRGDNVVALPRKAG